MIFYAFLGLAFAKSPAGFNVGSFQAKGIEFQSKSGIKARADTAVWNWGSLRAEFTGNVEVHQGEIHLSAKQMTIEFSEKKRIKSLEAKGAVVIEQGGRRAQSHHAVWNVSSDEIQLKGDPILKTNDSVFSGGTITISQKKEEIRCNAGCRLVVSESSK